MSVSEKNRIPYPLFRDLNTFEPPYWWAFFIFTHLEKKIRYTLGKEERLKSRKIIEQLFKEGKSFSVFPFRVVWQYQSQTEKNLLKAGFTASSRNFKKAVDRNRIKRLMKEGYRLQKNTLQEEVAAQNKPFAIFFIYVGKEIPAHLLVREKMHIILKRLQKIVHEQNFGNS